MTPTKVVIYDAGLIGYEEGLHLQKKIHSGLTEFKLLNRDNNNNLKGAKPDNHLILCEHKPVFTLGKSGKAENLLLDQEQLSDQGIEYFPTNRGGDITFHGPGQIVGYPIFDLDYFYHDVHRYVRALEEVIILTLKEYNIEGIRVEGLTGVWINDKNCLRKICAIGVHISRWVTMHGFALNVNTDLDYFNGIIPCGISDKNKTVTSMKKELNVEVALHAVKILIIEKFKEVFGIEEEVKN